MLLLLACAREAAPPPAPFTCATAPSVLAHPQATVVACDPLPNLPEVYQVALDEAGSRLTLAVLLRDGQPVPDRGEAALVRFLDTLPPERRRLLTLADLNGLLKALEAFPPGFGPRDWNFDMPGIGRSSLGTEPLVLTLYVSFPPPPEAPTVPPTFQRATLSGPPWAWRIEARTNDGGWGPLP